MYKVVNYAYTEVYSVEETVEYETIEEAEEYIADCRAGNAFCSSRETFLALYCIEEAGEKVIMWECEWKPVEVN